MYCQSLWGWPAESSINEHTSPHVFAPTLKESSCFLRSYLWLQRAEYPPLFAFNHHFVLAPISKPNWCLISWVPVCCFRLSWNSLFKHSCFWCVVAHRVQLQTALCLVSEIRPGVLSGLYVVCLFFDSWNVDFLPLNLTFLDKLQTEDWKFCLEIESFSSIMYKC